MIKTSRQIISRTQAHSTPPDFPNDLHPILTRIYLGRQVQSAAELDRSLQRLLSPHDLKGMDQAVDLLEAALRDNQRLLIIADYDTDGATSCALMIRALKMYGAKNVHYLVPNRFRYGYGLTPEIVDAALAYQPALIITVDNGIASIEGVLAARKQGIKVLITDHHLPGESLPAADAIVNPNQPGDSFGSKNLAGVGVAFYVMLALRSRLRESGWFDEHGMEEPRLAGLLDLVALGTVADLVPLDHNNRILVAQGMLRINRRQCCAGINALLDVAGRRQRRLTVSDLGFFVAPRLNAAGRLDDMSLGIECLLSDNTEQVLQHARELDELNSERRKIQADMQDQAMAHISALHLETEKLPKGICLYDSNWHQGVIGLVASKVKDKLGRPVIAFAPAGDDELRGSARSVRGVHIRDALDTIATRHPRILQKFGGHAMAAGLSIDEKNYEEFTRIFANEVERLLSDDDLEEKILSDGVLSDGELQMGFAEILQDAGPWGQGFPEPVFDGEFEVVNQRLVGETHVKMILRKSESNKTVDAIAFNLAPDNVLPQWERIHAAYRLDINEFRGQRSLQLVIEHAHAL